MRILVPLFSPPTGTWGGLTRTIAFAEAAASAGHALAFCAAGGLAEPLRARGFRVYPMPTPTMFGLPPALSRRIEARSQRNSLPIPPGVSFGNIWMVLLLSGTAAPDYLRRLVRAELDAAADFRPDALFTDLDPAAFLLARLIGRPLASAYAAIAQTGIGSLFYRLVRRGVRPILREHHLPDVSLEELCFGPQVLKIIPSVPALDGADPRRPDVCYVGHMIGEIGAPGTESFTPQPDRRYVFVYTGTGSISLDALERELPRLFPADGGTIGLVGAQTIQAEYRMGNARFLPYVPAGSVLPHCDWSILHAGQNSIVESILHGVPVLAFPGPIFERRFNARKLQEAGAGRMCELPEFRADTLRRLMQERAPMAEAAARLGAEMRSLGGAPAAVRALERWAG